ncbi:ABC transporter, ATP-binding protein [Acidipropionibacterium acidipropionici ATCC 4875]|uniref:ABC transporter, ATP-binding protein n=1 Tax=Acidipropionibacterium acidipropionici (strain ATCC 4875 / DSM 20272 / JCM 6432 / NBRC 12425 / NCIMB 8070 / 4) TaxID=1171373 RepID=K7S070_ACIA4|nr:ABC transporter ATP-binding protein [Acidipropionibacterium acidipropionici]AFV87932.1 ABC transporter, ATP-binding protein [Acidipropionibacterium acidipropionici ATCC 4875]ALN14680.1 histidinol phosphatase [Acidipropionibacterium acidipropionici]APZ09565.1 histidinol phosphatase [Acidipropionibacterium acidipropionici]
MTVTSDDRTRDDGIALATEELAWQADGTTIISGVTTRIRTDRMTMVVGLNGSGKTTLLHLMAGLRTPSHGRVLLEGRDLADIPRRRRARTIALLEQVPRANVDLKVADVVALGRIPHRGRWGRGGDRDPQVAAMMAATGVAELADRDWSSLSGGEKQRVQLARALAQEPRVLLLDEPTNHLDQRHQIGLLSQVRELGTTTVAVIHDLDLAAAFADDLLVMDSGRLVAQGPVDEVLTEEMVRAHFGVDGRVRRSDRMRFSWTGLVDDGRA